MTSAHDAWQLADSTCRGIAVIFNAYGKVVRAEPVARDYGSHWGFYPTLDGHRVPDSVALFVEKATGHVLAYGDVPGGGYTDYVGTNPKITWSDSVPISTRC